MTKKIARKRQEGRAQAATAVEERREPPLVYPSPARDRRTWLVVIPLALLVVVAFLPALGDGFVDFDDEVSILRNSQYRGLGWPQVSWAFTTFLLGVYQPLGWLLLEVQYVLFGLEARGYHLTSLLLHAANAVALYALTVALLVRCRPDLFLNRPWARAIGAGLATALFAVHPLRVEAVAWVSAQSYLPCALCAVLAVLAYLRAALEGPAPRWGWLAGSLALFAAALLCKAAAVGLPAVLLIVDVYPLRRLGGGPGRWFGPAVRRVWLEKAPFVALGLVFAGLAVAAKAAVGTVVPLEHDGVKARVALACYSTWFYLVKTVIPRGIAAYYSLPRRVDWFAPTFLLGLLATLALSAGLFALRRRWPGLLAAWLSYLAILAPSSGLARISEAVVADRYSYLALPGLVVLLAAGLGRAAASRPRARGGAIGLVAIGLAPVLALILILLTREQCRIWHDSETLWAHALDHGGPSGTAHYGLASAFFRRSEYGAAADHYAEAIRLNPSRAEAYNDLAMILAACPDPRYRDGPRAVVAASRACELTGWSQPALLDTLAAACAEAGDFAAAVRWQTGAIELLGDESARERYRSRLELYRARKPYREAAPRRLPTGAGRSSD
jgi:tetratricopeptide (TPR) repeat protein